MAMPDTIPQLEYEIHFLRRECERLREKNTALEARFGQEGGALPTPVASASASPLNVREDLPPCPFMVIANWQF